MGVRGLSLFITSSIWLFIDVSQLKGGKKVAGGRWGVWFIPPFVFVFACSSCQNCFDVICLKVTWICKRAYFHVFGFQGQPRDTDVASPILDRKGLQGILACTS